MEKGLLDKTGKPLEYWIKVVHAQKLEKHGEILKFLKTEHGFTHGFANFVSLKARESDAGSFRGTDLVQNQYKGKEALFPLFEQLLGAIKSFGTDVEVAPKKANVSLRTGKQFALIQPSTKTRIDVGLKLKGVEPQGRLETSGPFGSMCTHRVKVQNADDIDSELMAYLKQAYEASK